MKLQPSFLIIALLVINTLTGQIKIGDNPQNIHPASVLELESPSRVLVITRVTDAQMNTISPLRGALVYNTDQDCLHYYDGTQWINICEVFNNAFMVSTDAVFNPFSRDSTVVITQTDTNYNFEVNQITGDNIVDTSINGAVEIQQGSITGQQLSNATVSFDKLADGGNTGDLLRWNGAQWVLENEGAIDITEKDSIVGNEVLDARPGGALERFGAGNEGDPFTLDVRAGGIDNARLDKPNIPLSGFGAAIANVDMGGFQINNLQDPVAAQDAASKNYVDNQVSAINTLADGALYIGDATNMAQERIPSGDATISNAGVIDLETDAVETDEIVDNAVTTDKILDGTIGTLDIADNAITNIKMADDAVGTAEIIDGSVTRPKLEAGGASGDLMRWDGTNWVLVNETALNITENDGDPSNEFQDLNLDPSNILTLTNPVTLGNQVDLSAYVNDDTNELQDLSITGDDLSLSGDPTAAPIDLSVYLDNTDAQDLSLTGDDLSLSGDPTAAPIDLSPYVNDDTNELQDLSITGDDLSLSGDPTAAPIDLSVYLDNTDAQDLSLTGDDLSLSGDPTAAPIDLSPYVNDDTNELQDLSITGDDLSLSGDPTAAPINLSVYLDNTDAQDLSLTGDDLSLSGDPTAAPIDLSPYVNDDTNELQDLSITGDDLSLSGDPTAAPIDLSVYLDNTDAQDLSLTGDDLSLSGDPTAAPIDLSPYLDNTNLATTNLTQTLSTNRTYDINSGTLRFNGTGNVGIGTAGLPTSTLETGGSFATAINRLGGAISLDGTNHTVILTADSNITLPAANTSIGRIYIIKNPSFIVSTTAYTNLSGTPGITSIGSGQTITLQSDGVEWQQIN